MATKSGNHIPFPSSQDDLIAKAQGIVQAALDALQATDPATAKAIDDHDADLQRDLIFLLDVVGRKTTVLSAYKCKTRWKRKAIVSALLLAWIRRRGSSAVVAAPAAGAAAGAAAAALGGKTMVATSF